MTQQEADNNKAQDNAAGDGWFDLGPVGDFAEGSQVCTTVAGRAVVVFNVDGAFHAIANECPHAGLPLGDGDRRGLIITCPYHGYTYHIGNGRNIDWPHDEPPVRTYAVRVDGGKVQIRMEKPKKKEDADDAPRGPAPADTPDTPDTQDEPCEPDQPEEGGPHERDCPDGYPDRPPTSGRPE